MNLDFLKRENWPVVQTNASLTTKDIHKWCGELSSVVTTLLDRIKALEEINLNNQNSNNSNATSKPLFSDLFANKNKTSKLSNDEINVINAITMENEEIKKRECNLILSGLPESNGENQVKDDETKINELFTAINFDKTKMKRFVRFKNNTNNDKPKLILIEMKNKDDRLTIMKAAKNLKSSNYNNVYINFDLTPAQRVRSSELNKKRKEFNLRDATDDKDFYWGIRSNDLIKIKKKE